MIFVPLIWQRRLLVDPTEAFHAWFLCNLDPGDDDGPEWLISPYELLGYDGGDEEKLHLSSLIASVSAPTGYGKGGMRIQLPENIRAMGWLPDRSEDIVILSDAAGLSVWRPETFERHSIALNGSRVGRDARVRSAKAQLARSVDR